MQNSSCPQCGSAAVVPILYTYPLGPGERLTSLGRLGRVIVRPVVDLDLHQGPTALCQSCGHEWDDGESLLEELLATAPSRESLRGREILDYVCGSVREKVETLRLEIRRDTSGSASYETMLVDAGSESSPALVRLGAEFFDCVCAFLDDCTDRTSIPTDSGAISIDGVDSTAGSVIRLTLSKAIAKGP